MELKWEDVIMAIEKWEYYLSSRATCRLHRDELRGQSTLYHGAKLLSARLSRIYYGCYHFERALADELFLRDVVTTHCYSWICLTGKHCPTLNMNQAGAKHDWLHCPRCDACVGYTLRTTKIRLNMHPANRIHEVVHGAQ